MTTKQKMILKGTITMSINHGEMAPVKLFDKSDLNAIEEIVICKNPYGINDDFFGIKGGKYPIGISELVKFRKLRTSLGNVEEALKLVETIEL